MRVAGRELLRSGPEQDAWRAPISNERSDRGTAEGKRWRSLGLDRLRTTVDGVETTPGRSPAPATPPTRCATSTG
nr:hypothetical protein OG546_10025 [Streptomyces antimycoticus]